MQLNPRQDEAKKYVSGPCLVLAGAGSGKTGVICQKIAYLIQKCGYKARNIAAVTFTNKAAREMKERVAKMLGTRSYPWANRVNIPLTRVRYCSPRN